MTHLKQYNSTLRLKSNKSTTVEYLFTDELELEKEMLMYVQ